MSSRNKYLDGDDRKAAIVLFRALSAAKNAYENGERSAEVLRKKMKEMLDSEPRAQMQYISCADYDTLRELEVVKGKTLISMAVMLGKTRLIDNFVLG
jgi:pantoate--beta-alanine ligase